MSRLSSRNNVIIVVMVLVAAWTVYSNIISPLMQKQEMSAERPDMFGFDKEEELAVQSEMNAQMPVNTSVLFWDDAPPRDPFMYLAMQDKKSLRGAQQIRSVKRGKSVDNTPSMSGYIAGVESRLAVVDNKIVRIGQKVGAYTVLDIDSKGVHLVERESRARLKLKLEQ